MKIKIYTEQPAPFRMGGDRYDPVSTTTEALGPFDVGKGFEVYLVADPDGRTVVAEAKSGGLVGDTVEQVRKDVANTDDSSVISKQVEEAVARRERAVEIEEEEFWRLRRW